MPAAFPEITHFIVYLNGSYYKKIDYPVTTFSDSRSSIHTNDFYEISAFYGQVESERSAKVNISTVGNDSPDAFIQIFPTHFSDYFMLQGNELVKCVEVISPSGQERLVVTSPAPIIHTSSLSPGLYFIRIIDHQNQSKVFKAVKSNGALF